jgi:methyl-accepting chemotaxis protein
MKRLSADHLYLSFGVILLLVCGLGVTAYVGLTDVIDTAQPSNTRGVLQDCDKLLADVTSSELAARAFLMTGEQHYWSLAQTAQDSAIKDMQQLQRAAADHSVQGFEIGRLNSSVGDKFLLFETLIEKMPAAAAQAELVLKSTRRMEEITSEIGVIRSNEFAQVTAQQKAIESKARKIRSAVLYGGLAAAAFSAFLCFLVQRGMGSVTGEARRIARSLGEAVEQILDSTSQQTANSAEQATVALQASATIEEISRSGLQVALQARELAERASKVGDAGLGAAEKTNSAMQAIEEQAAAAAENARSLHDKTQTTADIVASANEISQQSHLLALNAAIQAAAAGEHGIAFAAVASEIKNLADQSHEATRQMRSFLGDMQKSIDASVQLTAEAVKRAGLGKQQAETAAAAICEINGSIQQSVHAFEQFAGGTNEQLDAFQQVTQAFKSISHAGERTAASTSQLERAAANLTTLGRQLAQAVDRY